MKRKSVDVMNAQGEVVQAMPLRWQDHLPIGITFRRGLGIEFGVVEYYIRRYEMRHAGYEMVYTAVRPAWLSWYSGGVWGWSLRWLTDKGIRSLNKTGLTRC